MPDPDELEASGRFPRCAACGHFAGSHPPLDDPRGCLVVMVADGTEEICDCPEFRR